MEEKKQNKYDPAVDLIRIVSILAVVMIHTTTRSIEASKFDLHNIPWTLFLNQISRFAVPVFFMLSGFVLELNYAFHTNYLTYIKKRISRIFVPYVFWSTVYYFFIYKHHTEGFIHSLINGDSSYQLYFIPSLLIFYILFPIMHKYYDYISNKFILFLLGIVQIAILYIDYSVKPLNLVYPIKIAILNYFIFVLGVVGARHKDALIMFIGKWQKIIFSLAVILGCYIFYEGFNGYLATKNYLTFYSQWRVSVFVYSILISMMLYGFFRKRLKDLHFIKKLSSLTFFIFFIHVIVLESVWAFICAPLLHLTQNHIVQQIWYDPLLFLIVVCVSYLLAFIAHKLPVLSKFTG